MDKSVLSAKILETGDTQWGSRCSLKTCGAAGRGAAVTPVLWGSRCTPPPTGKHTDLALGAQEESHTSPSGVEVHGLLAQGRGQLPLGVARPLAPNLVDIRGQWVRSGGGLSGDHGARGERGAP